VAVLKRALLVFPGSSDLYFNLGYVYFNMARKDSAEWAYHRSLEHDSTNAEAWYNLAYSMTEPERGRQSIDCLRRAIRINPDKLEAHYLMGMRLLDEPGRSAKETREALASLRRYVGAGLADRVKMQRIDEKLAKAGLRL
jgi:tetratricopeptide (TPR) repeat protein